MNASVTINGKPHHPYAVFVNRVTGAKGVAIANYDDQCITVELKMDDGTHLDRYRLVDDTRWCSSDDGISIPPYSAAVVIA